MKIFIAIALLLAPAAGLACSPPPSVWSIEAVWPDGVPSPLEGAVVLRGKEIEGGAGYNFVDVVQLNVRDADDEPVEGATEQDYSYGSVIVWRPTTPFAAGQTYAVDAVVSGDDAEWFPVPEEYIRERSFEFTVSDTAAAAPPVPLLGDLSAHEARVDVVQCLDDTPGACFCQEEEVTGQMILIRGSATLGLGAGGEYGEAYFLRLRVGPRDGDWRQTLTRPTLGGADPFRLSLGRRDAWPTDQICAQADVTDPDGQTTIGELRCVDITPAPPVDPQPDSGGTDAGLPDASSDDAQTPRADSGEDGTDPDEDSESGRTRNEGCSSSVGSAPVPVMLALFIGLFGVFRRRSARA